MPFEYMELIFCREFGWTLAEVRATSYDDIQRFIAMLGCEVDVAEAKKKSQGRQL